MQGGEARGVWGDRGWTGQSEEKMKPTYPQVRELHSFSWKEYQRRKCSLTQDSIQYCSAYLSTQKNCHFIVLFHCFHSSSYYLHFPILCGSGKQMHHTPGLQQAPKTPVLYNHPIRAFCPIDARSSKMFNACFASHNSSDDTDTRRKIRVR